MTYNIIERRLTNSMRKTLYWEEETNKKLEEIRTSPKYKDLKLSDSQIVRMAIDELYSKLKK
jgi:hypothetical protein